jgi:heme exporter protein C
MTQLAATPEPVPASGRGFARDTLLIASALLMALTLYLVYFWAPTEQNLGVSQRIFYFHVPLGWIGMVSIIVVAVASLMHLFTGRQRWDDLAYSTAELGVIYASLILVTGAIWGKPVWGVWWTWDPKLTTTLVLWFIYVAYLMIRAYGPMGSQGRRFASVIALIGAIDAPIIYMASIWWRTAHPALNIGPASEEGEAIGDSRIYITLLVSVIAFTVMYIALLVERYALRKSESDLDELHQRMA